MRANGTVLAFKLTISNGNSQLSCEIKYSLLSLSLFLSYVRSIYASRKCQINQFYLKTFDKCAFFRHPQIDLPNGKNRNPQPKLPNAYSNFTIGWKNYGKCKEIKKLFWIGYEYHLDNKYFNITLHSFEYSWWAFIWGMCYELWRMKGW